MTFARETKHTNYTFYYCVISINFYEKDAETNYFVTIVGGRLWKKSYCEEMMTCSPRHKAGNWIIKSCLASLLSQFWHPGKNIVLDIVLDVVLNGFEISWSRTIKGCQHCAALDDHRQNVDDLDTQAHQKRSKLSWRYFQKFGIFVNIDSWNNRTFISFFWTHQKPMLSRIS